MKAKLVIEAGAGEPFEQDIEVAPGDRLIFKFEAVANPDEMMRIAAERIQEFFEGKARFILLPHEVSVIRVRAHSETATSENGESEK